MKDFLYWLLSAQSFIKTGEGKVYPQSNLYTAMGIATFLGAIPVGMGLSYGASFPFLIPFIVLGLLFVFNKYTLGIVPKEIQDKHWRTQLARFKDPKFALQKSLYDGDPEAREDELEDMWEAEYGTKFENTSPPLLHKFRFTFLLILAFIGVMLGQIL